MSDEPGDPAQIFAAVDGSPFVAALIEYLDKVGRLPEMRRWHAMAIEMMALHPGMRVLDAGCGVGGAARELAASVRPNGTVTAVDVSVQMIETARSRDDGSTGVEYEIADVTALPYAAGSFDRARCERVLQHLPDPEVAVRELTRVTAPGGLVCVLDGDWRSMVIDVGASAVTDEFMGYLCASAPQPEVGRSLRRWFVHAGLVDVDVRVLPLTYTELADAAAIYPFFDEQVPAEADVVPAELRDAWFAALRRADAEDTLWVSATGYVAVGTVPGAAA
ncbi:MAG TPA: methyltransferase domain-containing protein [Jiangellaceae bacterium]|nr:methyltransferase domain-containing protein [Jiangellaceae bacterium]